jgi:hypothetical protein
VCVCVCVCAVGRTPSQAGTTWQEQTRTNKLTVTSVTGVRMSATDDEYLSGVSAGTLDTLPGLATLRGAGVPRLDLNELWLLPAWDRRPLPNT